MNALATVRDWLVEHGAAVGIGVTLVMLGFAALVWWSRSIATRHRLAGLSVLATAGYLALAIVPLPRLAWPTSPAAPATTPVDADLSGRAPGAGIALPGAPFEDVRTDLLRREREPERIRHEPDLHDGHPTDDDGGGARAAAATPTPLATRPAIDQRPSQLPTTTATTAFDDWLAAALLLGTALFAAQLLLGCWHLRGILKRSRPADARLSELVPLPPRTRIRIATDAVQPFCFGVLRRTIVLPAHLATAGDAARFVLLHECAHVRAGDPAMRMVAAILRTALFWHPLFWWLQRQLRFHGELLADDAAAHGSVPAYVRCMMTLSTNPDRPAGTALATTIFRRRSELFRRLEMMLERDEAIPLYRSRARNWLRIAASAALVACCASTFGVQRVAAQEPEPGTRGNSRIIRELRSEIETLRAEIESLRRYADRRASGQRPRTASPVPRIATPPAAGAPPGVARTPAANSQNGAEPGAVSLLLPEPATMPEEPSSERDRDVQRFARLLRQAKERRAATTIGRSGQVSSVADPAEPGAGGDYVVQKGDSLARISRKVYGTHDGVGRLMRLNPDLDPRRLKVGERLRTGGTSDPLLQAATNLNTASATPSARTAPPSAGTAPSSARTGQPAGVPTTIAAPPRAPRTARSPRSTNEYAELVTRCIELKGDIDIAKVNMKCAETEQEREICAIRIRTKEQQYRAVRGIIEHEIEQAKEDLEHARTLADKGFVSSRELRASEAKLDMLSGALR